MAKENESKPTWQAYEAGNVAGNYADHRDFQRASISVSGVPMSDDMKMHMQLDPDYHTSDRGIKTDSGIYRNMFLKGLYSQKIGDLAEFYKGVIEGLSEEVKVNALKLIAAHKDTKYEKAIQKYTEAVEDTEDPTKVMRNIERYNDLSGEELDKAVESRLREAEGEKKKYHPVVKLLGLLQESRDTLVQGNVRKTLIDKLTA